MSNAKRSNSLFFTFYSRAEPYSLIDWRLVRLRSGLAFRLPVGRTAPASLTLRNEVPTRTAEQEHAARKH